MLRRSIRLGVLFTLLLLGLLAVSAAPALAQGSANPTAVVNTGALNVRSGPDYSFPRVTTLYNGQQVTLLARYSQNQWVQIRIPNGITGWVNSNFLLTSVPISSLPVVGPPTSPPPPPSGPPPSSNPTATVNTGALNVRSGPGPNFPVVTVVYNGDTVTLLGRNADGSWVLIRTQSSVQGWVNSNMLLISVPINSLPVVPGGPPAGTGATGVVTTGMLNVRQGPGMAFPVVTKVAQGQTVSLLGRNAQSSWLLVRTSSGTQGWASSAHIQANMPLSSLPVVNTPPPPNHATVSVGALNVRVAPSPNAPLVGTVLYGAQLGLLGRNASGTWVLVQTPGGAVGWVNSTYVIPSVPISSLPIAG